MSVKKTLNLLVERIDRASEDKMYNVPGLGEISEKGLFTEIAKIILNKDDVRAGLSQSEFDAFSGTLNRYNEAFQRPQLTANEADPNVDNRLADIVTNEISLKVFQDTLVNFFDETNGFNNLYGSGLTYEGELYRITPVNHDEPLAPLRLPNVEVKAPIAPVEQQPAAVSDSIYNLVSALQTYNDEVLSNSSEERYGLQDLEFAKELITAYDTAITQMGHDGLKQKLAELQFMPEFQSVIDDALKLLEINSFDRFELVDRNQPGSYAKGEIEHRLNKFGSALTAPAGSDLRSGNSSGLLAQSKALLQTHKELTEIYGPDYAEKVLGEDGANDLQKSIEQAHMIVGLEGELEHFLSVLNNPDASGNDKFNAAGELLSVHEAAIEFMGRDSPYYDSLLPSELAQQFVDALGEAGEIYNGEPLDVARLPLVAAEQADITSPAVTNTPKLK